MTDSSSTKVPSSVTSASASASTSSSASALALPSSRAAIRAVQSERKRIAVERARRSPFWRDKLVHIDLAQLDHPSEWAKIPILNKEQLRALDDKSFYSQFCHAKHDGISEFWRSGGATGKPLFYPRSRQDLHYAMLSFRRVFQCLGLGGGDASDVGGSGGGGNGAMVHDSFPLGIHPVGQMLARAAQQEGIAVNWAGAGTTTPTAVQLDLIQRLQPTIWMGMSSYGLHLANLAEAQGVDLAAASVQTVICSAEPLSDPKRAKLARGWGAQVFDSFGMTEAGMMGAEDPRSPRGGFRIWSDLYFIEVVDPDTFAPVAAGDVGSLVVTPLWTNNVTPFLRWLSGDLVVYTEADDDSGLFSVFPKLRHAHRTSGFFKVRGVNINHTEFEDFMFSNRQVTDFKCEAVSVDDQDVLRVSVEFGRDVDVGRAMQDLRVAIKRTFESTPQIEILAGGSLAREFETSVKAPRFQDRR